MKTKNQILYRMDDTEICTSCWELKENCNCNSEIYNIIRVDGYIADVICKLNKKGFETKYSCSGHSNQFLGLYGYVMFENNLSEEYFNNLPTNWSFKKQINPILQYNIKNKDIIGMSKKEKDCLIIKQINNINKWIDENLKNIIEY